MSAGEEEEHGYEAIIKALMKALTDIKGSPMDSLKPPTFDWNSLEEFEDFWLFIKGMESWYTLQGIPNKAGYVTRSIDITFVSVQPLKYSKGKFAGSQ